MNVELIDRYPEAFIMAPNDPALDRFRGQALPEIVYSMWCEAECGCYCVIGMRTDKGEVATGSCACSDKHAPVIHNFNDLLAASTESPSDLPVQQAILSIMQIAYEHVPSE